MSIPQPKHNIELDRSEDPPLKHRKAAPASPSSLTTQTRFRTPLVRPVLNKAAEVLGAAPVACVSFDIETQLGPLKCYVPLNKKAIAISALFQGLQSDVNRGDGRTSVTTLQRSEFRQQIGTHIVHPVFASCMSLVETLGPEDAGACPVSPEGLILPIYPFKGDFMIAFVDMLAVCAIAIQATLDGAHSPPGMVYDAIVNETQSLDMQRILAAASVASFIGAEFPVEIVDCLDAPDSCYSSKTITHLCIKLMDTTLSQRVAETTPEMAVDTIREMLPCFSAHPIPPPPSMAI